MALTLWGGPADGEVVRADLTGVAGIHVWAPGGFHRYVRVWGEPRAIYAGFHAYEDEEQEDG